MDELATVLTDHDLPVRLPDPDAIRAAIDAADERARLLRRLLRTTLRLLAAEVDAKDRREEQP